MSVIEDVLDQVSKDKVTEGYIPCTDKKNQESVRVMTFNRKNKLNDILRKDISITKTEDENGNFYVKVYKKPAMNFLIKDPETGELIPYDLPIEETDSELKRILGQMREDQLPETEIQEYIKNWKKG